MINQKSMIKQMVEFNKAAADGFKGFLQFQEQVEEHIKTMYDEAPYFPEACKKAMAAYITWHKSLHNNIIAVMDDSFKKAEEYLSV
ncbi:hypothetical protein Dvar_25650 [Desulfosarcina variabilis str. Montpellier]|uniref:hypothetical protein n=1 Tax=Desulfosarcina variabilis TaxID=2300 RepID=UPI003AFB0F0B